MRRTLIRIAFGLLLIGGALVQAELGVRVVMAFRLGPSVLLYGTRFERARGLQPPLEEAPWHVKATKVERDQQRVETNGGQTYLKYRPHQQRFIWDEHGERHPATINSQGFRGDEFDTVKAPGVYRVVNLGASSTFGYHDRDDETYPFYLERQLNDWLQENPQPDIVRFEVLNLGMPHLDSAEIAALFEAEVPQLQPDAVTFYEGANDARDLPVTFGERVLRRLARQLVIAQLAQQIRTSHFERFGEERFRAAAAWMPERAIRNLDRLADDCRALGVRFLLVTQQARSLTLTPAELRRTDFEAEADLIRARLRERGWVDFSELQFLLHVEIVAAQRAWVEKRDDVELVDAIAAIDAVGRRDTLLSWVHLHPDGNRIVADAIAQRIVASLTAGPGLRADLRRSISD